ncbi:MAG: hypothetical protein HY651_12085 [Acidobacteria bacterium]|nr:hypothetical protein [Acidobacteriota bacterium]
MSSSLRFLNRDGTVTSPAEWLEMWLKGYPDRYPEAVYNDLIARSAVLRRRDFERMGAWKDGALSGNGDFNGKWKANMGSVAYEIWQIVASELVGFDTNSLAQDSRQRQFLEHWANREGNGKIFGLSRATTLLHFLTGGRRPIFDSNVRRAIASIFGSKFEYTLDCYFDKYCPAFDELNSACCSAHPRAMDKALFNYGRYIKAKKKLLGR